jgi:ribosome modulation factor
MTATETRQRHERAYMQGEQAFRGGRKIDACPYRSGTMTSERNSWMQGFEAAKSRRKNGNG